MTKSKAILLFTLPAILGAGVVYSVFFSEFTSAGSGFGNINTFAVENTSGLDSSNVDIAESTPPTKPTTDAAKQAKILASVLNMRSNPSQSSPVIHKLQKGEKVEVLATSGKWSKIMHNGDEGWVFGRFIKLVDKQSIGKSDAQFTNTVNKEPLSTSIVNLNTVNLQRWTKASKIKETLGNPAFISKKITHTSTRELWEYQTSDKAILYLYFENNILVSWQISRPQI